MARPKLPKKPAPGLPDRETLLAFLRDSGDAAKADVAAHFGLKGGDRRAMRDMLKELEAEGALARRGRKGWAERGSLPPVGVVDVAERDADGEFYVRLAKGGEDAPAARLAPDREEARRGGAPGLGDRLLVRFEKVGGDWEARTIKKLGRPADRVLGVIRKGRRETRIEPVERRSKDVLLLSPADAEGLKDGDLVLAAVRPASTRYGPKPGKVLEVIGREDEPRAASLLAIHAHGLPTGFSEAAEAEARAAQEPTLKGREDLRDLPLITIDPADARDHDDAVYAHADEDPKNEGGWVVWVAIADVAAYVRVGSALDREGREKGNSTYFPDRVEPMLPHALSSNLCSLVEGHNRACLAVRMVFDKTGRKTGHRFVRGLMRCAAGVSYEQAQAAIDGRPDDKTGPILEPVLKPLWAAYHAMLKGRLARQPLAIQTLERRVTISLEGEITGIAARVSLEAHRLIEEMMIQANVCAAETLEKTRLPLIYRIHDAPSQEKVFNLVDFLQTIGINWAKGEAPRTDRFNRLLAETRDGPHAEIVNEVVLRTQMQAIYSTENIGHFGLNLDRYAHFTSPIRRYADLTVHRGLIRALKLGDDGMKDEEMARLVETAEHITTTERRSMAAERDATDRYVAAWLEDRVGAEFEGRITGVTRFGLFVRLSETGADGLVPVSTLGGEFFHHDDRAHALVGERTGARWTLGRTVTVRLVEATPVTGGLVFEIVSAPEPHDPNAPRPRLGVRSRAGKGGPPPRGKPGKPSNIRRGKRR